MNTISAGVYSGQIIDVGQKTRSVGEKTIDFLAEINWAAIVGTVFWSALTAIGGVLTFTFITMGGILGISLAVVYGLLTCYAGGTAISNLILSFYKV